MKQKRRIVILAAMLALVVIIGVGAYAASGYGTANDPLVTLSYLNEKLVPQMMEEIQGKIDTSIQEIKDSIGDSSDPDNYVLVKLTSGQKVTCFSGAELLLRSGSASCSGNGYLDLSGGSALSSGSTVTANHLYMAPEDGCIINVTSEKAEILIRGAYTVS